jgi:hypothetical protein
MAEHRRFHHGKRFEMSDMTDVRDAYQKALESIDKILKRINGDKDSTGYLGSARDYRDQMLRGFRGSNDMSAGLIVSQFDAAVNHFQGSINSLVADQTGTFYQYWDDLQNKYYVIEDRLKTIKKKCDEETWRKKIPLSDLPF